MCIFRSPCPLVLSRQPWHWYVYFSINAVVLRSSASWLNTQVCYTFVDCNPPRISPRQVDRVVNKTRRRSSLLTIPWQHIRRSKHLGRRMMQCTHRLAAHTVYYTSVNRNTAYSSVCDRCDSILFRPTLYLFETWKVLDAWKIAQCRVLPRAARIAADQKTSPISAGM